MGRNRMIAKSCPKCELQVAVASKTCKCGHTFFSTRRAADVSPSEDAGEERRRTARVRRGKPQFYDSQDYQRKKRRTGKKRSCSQGSGYEETLQKNGRETVSSRARRRRSLRRAGTAPGPRAGNPTGVPSNNREQAGSAPNPPPLGPSQLARAKLILDEINRKMSSVTWRPDG